MDELEAIVDQLEYENNKRAASDPLIQTSLRIVEQFLKDHPVLCYGGTAINNLLPPDDQFYDPESDIPDYDFFSQTPQEHAMQLANKLYEAGIKAVEVKPGIHLGTFKVFADYEGVADITQLDADVFTSLWDANIVKNGIHYVTPNFLRMSMYLELSRPRGDVSRWKKVYLRLALLNKHYPIACKSTSSQPSPKIPVDAKRRLRDLLNSEEVVILGVNAAQVHLREDWTLPLTLLATKDTIARLTEGLRVTVQDETELVPRLHSVRLPEQSDDDPEYLRIYETNACHSYHQLGKLRVASIPTILQFFFASLYSPTPHSESENVLCVAQRLMDLADSKPKRRFALLTPIDCLGTQTTLTDMRRDKAALYAKTSANKLSAEFLRYFFTYSPSMTKTQRATLRKALRKTQRTRTSS